MTEGDKDFAKLISANMRSSLTTSLIHVKVGTHPTRYALMIGRTEPPKVGDCLELESDIVGGKPIRVRCWRINSESAWGDALYFMELM